MISARHEAGRFPTQKGPGAMPRPIIPADLKATIDRHMALFAGWQMLDTEDSAGADGADTGGSADQGANGDVAGKDGDKPLGPNGEKALHAEREARKKSDAEVATLKAQMARLAEAFGVKPDDGKSDDDDKVASLAKSVDAILHNSAVDRVARTHGITDKDDLALLMQQANEQAMEALAKRLQPAKNDDDSAKPKRRPPAPDRSQGQGGSDHGGAKSSVAEVMAERRAAREAKK